MDFENPCSQVESLYIVLQLQPDFHLLNSRIMKIICDFRNFNIFSTRIQNVFLITITDVTALARRCWDVATGAEQMALHQQLRFCTWGEGPSCRHASTVSLTPHLQLYCLKIKGKYHILGTLKTMSIFSDPESQRIRRSILGGPHFRTSRRACAMYAQPERPRAGLKGGPERHLS